MISVIIPAHNEGGVITRCLKNLLGSYSTFEEAGLEVIVVCNGCNDNTAQLAAEFEGVQVVETDVPSKTNALNLGDGSASHFPRAYLDADVAVDADALLTCASEMDKHGILASAPKISINQSRSSAAVKAFYRVWMALPYLSQNDMVGSGLFILSEQGRARFEEFPAIIGDDAYVRALYKSGERRTISQCQFEIFAPHTLENLIKIKTRARFGNMEIRQKYPDLQTLGTNKASSLGSIILSKPWLAPSAVVYAYVIYRSIQGCKKRMKEADYSTWERDDSSRNLNG